MGLLKHLLGWPVTGPSALIRFSLRQVEKAAQVQLTDDTPAKEELMELQLLLELGEIDEEEFRRREAAAMARLREAREWRERLGLAAPWAPLGFSGEADDRPSEGESTGPARG